MTGRGSLTPEIVGMNGIKVYLNDGGSLTPEIVGMNDIKVYLFLAEMVSE